MGFEATFASLQDVGVWDVNPATPGFVAATLLAVVVTLLTSPPSREEVELFDRVNAPAIPSAAGWDTGN